MVSLGGVGMTRQGLRHPLELVSAPAFKDSGGCGMVSCHVPDWSNLVQRALARFEVEFTL